MAHFESPELVEAQVASGDRSMKPLLPIFALLLVLLATLVATNLLGTEDEPNRELAPFAQAPSAAPVTQSAELSEPLATESELRSRQDATSVDLPQQLIASGTIVITGSDGLLEASASGSLELNLASPLSKHHSSATHGVSEQVRVNVVRGRWTIQFDLSDAGVYEPYGDTKRSPLPFDTARQDRMSQEELSQATLSVRSFHVTDSSRRLRTTGKPQHFAFGELDLRLGFTDRSPFRLVVKDAHTGSHLSQVTILSDYNNPFYGQWTIQERIEASIAHDTPSPVELQPRWPSRFPGNPGVGKRPLPHYVGSPGYAWQRVDLSFLEGETYTARLHPGGNLKVDLRGTTPPEKSILRIRANVDEEPIVELPIGELRAFAFDGLELGEYQVSAEIGDPDDFPIILAQATVQIAARKLTQATLDLALPPEFQLAPVAGQLSIPPEWEFRRISLSLVLQNPSLDGSSRHHVLREGDLKPLAADTGTYAFDFGELQTGSYTLKLSPANYGITFELGPTGQTRLRLELPKPLEVTVRLRDVTTDEIAPAGTLVWTSALDSASSGHFSSSVLRVPGEDYFRFTVPEGSLTFLSATNRYTLSRQTQSVFSESSFLVDVRPSYRAKLRLMDGPQAIPWPPQARVKATALSGQGRLESASARTRELLFTVTDPGRYLVSLPSLPGFETHAPIEVQFIAGELQQLDVKLVRTN